MTEKTINCAECNVEFTFEENPKYPRKYCLNCSAEKKKEFKVMSKTEAKVTPDAEMGAPVEKINSSGRPYESLPQGTFSPKSKEYHLSPEQVRSNALDLAIKSVKGFEKEFSKERFWEIVKEFEEWINGN